MIQKTSERRMKLGLFPQTDLVPRNGPTLRFRELQAVAQMAEEMGFEQLWIADHLLLRSPNEAEQGCWEEFTFLSGLAAIPSRIHARMADRHTHIRRLTEPGRQALKAALPFWQQAQATVMSRFGQDRTAVLLTELQALEVLMQSN